MKVEVEVMWEKGTPASKPKILRGDLDYDVDSKGSKVLLLMDRPRSLDNRKELARLEGVHFEAIDDNELVFNGHELYPEPRPTELGMYAYQEWSVKFL